jgi:signal transduction histidine kinase
VAIGAETDLDRILELIVKRGRALFDAHSIVILLQEGDDLVVAARSGRATLARGLRIPLRDSILGEVLAAGRTERVADVCPLAPTKPDASDAQNALVLPLVHRGQRLGVLTVFDGAHEASLDEEQELVLRAFAASAATAVATARSVQTDRLRDSLESAEAERRRWARELHDETLQALGGLRVLLASTLRRDKAALIERVLPQALEQLDSDIANLRAIITDLRPAALDELGLRPAIEALIERRTAGNGLAIACRLDLPGNGWRPAAELETTVYRIVQEAVANIVKHAQARHAEVLVTADEHAIRLTIIDDGHGFDTAAPATGFGLMGIRERVELAGGRLAIESSTAGTRIDAALPMHVASAPGADVRRSAGGRKRRGRERAPARAIS